MEGRKVTRFKWFWAWQDEAEEQWLGKMSQRGHHLSSVGFPGIYTFVVAEPRNYVYRLDYQTFRKKDRREYLQLFQDAGWEHMGEMSSWQYFRKEAGTGETPEIFTDVESKIAKYRRVLASIAFFYVVLIAISWGRTWTDGPYSWWGVVNVISAMVVLLLSYALLRTAIRIRQLRRR